MHEPERPQETSGTAGRQRPRELAMCAAWNGGLTRSLTTRAGQPVTVIFPGHWSHGFGPDFADAMLQFGASGFTTGAVEIHTRASDWTAHGHHLDERYNDVVLHIVTIDDLPETRRADGQLVPVAVLAIADDVLFAIDRRLPDIWSELGGSVCAADLTAREPERIRAALHRLGDARLAGKVAMFEGELAEDPPDVVLLRWLLDGFGYTENRAPMRQLAGTLARFGLGKRPFDDTELAAVCLGVGGFLPLSPAEAHLGAMHPDRRAEVERRWWAIRDIYDAEIMPATAWHVGRTRPANHPVARLIQAACLLGATGGAPVGAVLDIVRAGGSAVEALRRWSSPPGNPPLGASRAIAIVASTVIPFSLAYAAHTDDPDLEDAAARAWADIPAAEWMRPARRALRQVTGGTRPLRGLGERGHQGLLHLDRSLCTPRRCYECPIAAEVVRDRTSAS